MPITFLTNEDEERIVKEVMDDVRSEIAEIPAQTSGKAFWVHTYTDEDGKLRADKTNEEIYNAFTDGQALFCVYSNYVLQLLHCTMGMCVFETLFMGDSHMQVFISNGYASATFKSLPYVKKAELETAIENIPRPDLSGYLTEQMAGITYLPKTELPNAINTALAQAKESGEFDGVPGQPGEPGKDYVLTEADKEEIAEKAAEKVEIPEVSGSGVDVTAQPGQMIVVKAVDENGKPTAWEAVDRTHWVEGGMVEILGETSYSESNTPPYPALGLLVGEKYTVNWNGTNYDCVAQDMTADGQSFVVLGDLYTMTEGGFGNSATGEPFVIIENPPDIADVEGTYLQVVPMDGSAEGAFSIKGKGEVVHKLPGKFLPDGVPYVAQGLLEVLTECQPTYDEPDASFYVTTSNVPTTGDTCTVNWNGLEYICVTQDAPAMAPGYVILGDGTNFGLSGNGEPFLMMFGVQNGMGMGVIVPLDGTTELTISIYADGKVYHKIDKNLLPSEAVNNMVIVTKKPETDDSGNYIATHSASEIFMANETGKVVVLKLWSNTFTLSNTDTNAMEAQFGRTYYRDGNLCFDYITVGETGILSGMKCICIASNV